MRVTIFTDAPAPYRIELFKHAQEQIGDIDVLFQRPAQPLRNWDLLPVLPYPYEYPTRFRLPLPRRSIYVHPTLGRELLRRKPDVIVAYGFSPAVWQCAAYCRKADVPLLIASDGTRYTDPMHGPEAWGRRHLLRRASGFIAACSLAAEYFTSLGAPSHSVSTVRLTTDLKRIRAEVARRRSGRAGGGSGVSARTVCYVGRLIPQKRVMAVCEAFARVSRRIDGLELLIAGDGPEAVRLSSFAAASGSRIQMLGMLSPDELLDVYAASELMMFAPVMERYGMVVIEALASGVPVITTRECGAGRDLILEGWNGWFVSEGSVDALTQGLLKALEVQCVNGDSVAEHVIRRHDIRIEADRFAEAVLSAYERRLPKREVIGDGGSLVEAS